MRLYFQPSRKLLRSCWTAKHRPEWRCRRSGPGDDRPGHSHLLLGMQPATRVYGIHIHWNCDRNQCWQWKMLQFIERYTRWSNSYFGSVEWSTCVCICIHYPRFTGYALPALRRPILYGRPGDHISGPVWLSTEHSSRWRFNPYVDYPGG
jgi:hypothetical protein